MHFTCDNYKPKFSFLKKKPTLAFIYWTLLHKQTPMLRLLLHNMWALCIQDKQHSYTRIITFKSHVKYQHRKKKPESPLYTTYWVNEFIFRHKLTEAESCVENSNGSMYASCRKWEWSVLWTFNTLSIIIFFCLMGEPLKDGIIVLVYAFITRWVEGVFIHLCCSFKTTTYLHM